MQVANQEISESQQRILQKLEREMGDIILGGLRDDEVLEILLNPDGRLWEDRFSTGMRVIGEMSAVRAENLMGTIANALGEPWSKANPIVEGELPTDGSRFEGVLPPIVDRPTFAIRKKATKIFTFADYVKAGIMTIEQRDVLLGHIRAKHNILVAGGTGSGKTTLCNAILHAIAELHPEARMVIIEDTRELQCPIENKVMLRTSDTIDMTRLLKVTLRLRPDGIGLGEVRDKAALAMVKAWNTGHGLGVCTTHANTAESALTRIENLIQEAGVPPNRAVIAEAINCVVSIQKTKEGRRIDGICTVKGATESSYELVFH
jgi:P-type conjugative transfer ATPase TrbB